MKRTSKKPVTVRALSADQLVNVAGGDGGKKIIETPPVFVPERAYLGK